MLLFNSSAFVCKCIEMGWYPTLLVKGFLRSLRQAWLFAFKSLDLIILFKMNLLYYFALYYRNMDIDIFVK